MERRALLFYFLQRLVPVFKYVFEIYGSTAGLEALIA